MGRYNPHVPQILGEEWVPIRNEDLVFSPSVNVMERGHSFQLATSRTLSTGRFYNHELAPNSSAYQVAQMAVYPAGLEDSTGPIRSVLIPVNGGGVTGSGMSAAPDVATCLLGTSDEAVLALYTGGLQDLSMFFATSRYPELANKRILNVSFIYSGYVTDTDAISENIPFVDPDPVTPITNLYMRTDSASQNQAFFRYATANTGSLWELATALNPASNFVDPMHTYGVVDLGDVFPMPIGTSDRFPWTYSDLLRFEPTAGSTRLHMHVMFQIPQTNPTVNNCQVVIDYAALRVIFCEERRVAIGGKFTVPYVHGTNIIDLKDMSHNANPVLAAGNYTATMSWVSPGDIDFGLETASGFPKLNALREYYALPTHQGIQVNVPSPLEDHIGDVFTKEQTQVLPQLTLHTSGGPLTEVHVYGRQAVAQVYGTVTATQEILDSAAGGTYSWPQVRYYARRFGNTTVPLVLDSPTITGAGLSVQITPNEFDALDEIIDGWKQVTLRFTTPPTMGAGINPQWRWSATGETAGNRWEVLGCTAPALSGTPGNLFTQVPSPHQLSSATYGAPNSGSTINMGWLPQYAPAVTAASDDQTSDAVLIFAQDMLPVTGMTVTLTSQPVSGIGFDCGSNPCCIPSAIFYNRVQWSPVTGSLVLLDTFSRAATGWGTADTGQTYTDTGGTVPGNYIVTGTQGTHVLDGVANVNRISVITGSYTDSHQEVVGSINVTPAGASIRTAIIGHYVDANNFDVVDFRWATSGNLEIVIANVVAGVQTALTNFSVAPYIAGQQWHFVADFVGGTIRAKAWYDGAAEPDSYLVEAAAAFTSGGIGIRSIRSTGNTNTTAVASYDDYTVGPSTWNFGSYELQRMDELTDWETIMRATDPRTISFNDFEARVGLESDYRIRAVDLYDFAGSWSSTVSETVDEPGVTIAESCSGGHLLIFTSNSQQDGTSNLAYSTIWDNQVSEDFDFPEAGDVIFQKMYGKDFITAFRPLERGGERFTRTVLVQAAAIDPETLGDFTDLRDMAWAQLSYVCVRDEEGNRWFATVLVPNGRVQLNRTLYMAPVTIQEVTDTPYPVDP